MDYNGSITILKNFEEICIDVSTNLRSFSYQDYEKARDDILSNIFIHPFIPDWIIENRLGSTFRRFIQNRYKRYVERRKFISESCADIKNNMSNKPKNTSLDTSEFFYEISQYLPLKISDPTVFEYVEHHLRHFDECVKNKLFSSSFYHLHILYMIFVYFQILRIAEEKERDFSLCWIGFPTQEKAFLKNPSNPFSFSKINEKTVFRFFRLVGFNDGTIGDISDLVNKRNNHLHANGEIFFTDELSFSEELTRYLEKMKKIIDKQKVFLEAIYSTIITNFPDDYSVTRDDIETSFTIPYFFSIYELKLLADKKTDIFSQYILENY